MTRFTQSMTLTGTVIHVGGDETGDSGSFAVRCRAEKDPIPVFVSRETQFRHLHNLDGLDRDRTPTPEGFDPTDPAQLVKKYVRLGRLVTLYGVWQVDEGPDGDQNSLNARIVHLLYAPDPDGGFLFQQTHWWLTQIARLADTWLDALFGTHRAYDFTRYRTNLGIANAPRSGTLQECATLSRLVYGLSSAYLLTGCERYLHAAREGVTYQRQVFRSLSNDGQYCFWAHGKQDGRLIVPSLNADDRDTIPIYEQIYAVAGLTQYYRITLDGEVLHDVKRTLRMMDRYFRDDERDEEFGDNRPRDGYFSHVDYATLRADTAALGDNRLRKNWNSVGDHLPAYLINLILALHPAPRGAEQPDYFPSLTECLGILTETTRLIVEHFPDPDPEVPYVRERFFRDWSPDTSWRWQQDRAVVGHNLKIAWNLARVANWYQARAADAEGQDPAGAREQRDLAARLLELAGRLADDMARYGLDLYRGGVFDVVERHPRNRQSLEFPWFNTKDFWQQEQGILAYLLLYGCTGKEDYLALACETMAFWNLFFLDHDYGGVYFRVTENGLPYILGQYGNKGGHAIAGYHSFELNFLAHVYLSTYVNRKPFCLYFRPERGCRQQSINVLPDFVPPRRLQVRGVTVGGIRRAPPDPWKYQIELQRDDLGAEIMVELGPAPGPEGGPHG